MLKVFEYAFFQGCGVRMEDVIQSPRFAELLAEMKKLDDYRDSNIDQGTALRSGHQVFGQLINTYPELEALRLASQTTSTFGHGIEYRPLIQMLGECIIAEAQNCLPQDVVELATEWTTASVDRQIEICNYLFCRFRSTDQGEIGTTLTMDIAAKAVWNKLRHDESETDAYLPRLYGIWNPETSPANCQGKSQMLVAFARLAGARVMTIHPIECCKDLISAARYHVRNMIFEDLGKRGLVMDPEMAESLHASVIEEQAHFHTDFHVAVAIQLVDKRWVIIDPHGIDWGIVPDVWNMDHIDTMLMKYGDVLPGLTIMGHDDGTAEQYLKERLKLADDLILRSGKMEKVIKERVRTVWDLIEILGESDDMTSFILSNYDEKNETCPFDPNDSSIKRYFANVCVLGSEAMESPMAAAAKAMNPDCLESAIHQWLTVYHTMAMNLFLDQIIHQGEIIHPICDFGLPEYSLAIAALNSANLDFGSPTGSFFIDYSFDQTSLHNAMIHRTNPELARAAQKTAASLRFLHPLCKYRLL